MAGRMGILKMHVDLHREIFALPGLATEPFLQIGHQIIESGSSFIPAEADRVGTSRVTVGGSATVRATLPITVRRVKFH